MLIDNRLKPCPFCGKTPSIFICDEECNIYEDEYMEHPYSGLYFGICHVADLEQNNSLICPIATFEDELIGTQIYESIDELVENWNRRIKED